MHLIAIAGLSCSGKTTLAQELNRRYDAPVIALDDYYLPLSELTFSERQACNFDAPEIFDHALLLSHLTTLKAGAAIEKPVYDFVEFTRAPETQVIEPGPFIVLEGLYALFWPAVNALTDTRLFLDIPVELCLERRIGRDVAQRGRTEHEVRWRFGRHVLPMFEKHVQPTRTYATHVLGVDCLTDIGARAESIIA